jgi:plastocyanin
VVGTTLSRIPIWLFVLSVPVVAGIAILVTAGVSDDSGSATAGSARDADSVVIKNFEFSPNRITVTAGTPITVVNDDNVTHTFTANRGAFDTGDLNSGRRADVMVARAGTYPYHCEIHPFMKATVDVSP